MAIKLLIFWKTRHLLLLVGLAFLLPLSSFAETQVTLAWQPNAEPDIAGYRVYYRIEGDEYTYSEPAWEGTETSCTIDIADEEARYYFVARAFDTEGFESLDSEEACFGCTPNHNINPVPEPIIDSNTPDDDTGCFVWILYQQ